MVGEVGVGVGCRLRSSLGLSIIPPVHPLWSMGRGRWVLTCCLPVYVGRLASLCSRQDFGELYTVFAVDARKAVVSQAVGCVSAFLIWIVPLIVAPDSPRSQPVSLLVFASCLVCVYVIYSLTGLRAIGVQLPGQILVGEGKPNNQNHAVIFTRGEAIQAIDMNQDASLEDAIKIRQVAWFRLQVHPSFGGVLL